MELNLANKKTQDNYKNFEEYTHAHADTFPAISSKHLLENIARTDKELQNKEQLLKDIILEDKDHFFVSNPELKEETIFYLKTFISTYSTMLKNLATNNIKQVMASEYDAFDKETGKMKTSMKKFRYRIQQDKPHIYQVLFDDIYQNAHNELSSLRNVFGHSHIEQEIKVTDSIELKNFQKTPTEFFGKLSNLYLNQTKELYDNLVVQLKPEARLTQR
ncbi:MAG: hypothetical protein ACQESE_04965 [Nanobdellota archaeon]